MLYLTIVHIYAGILPVKGGFVCVCYGYEFFARGEPNV